MANMHNKWFLLSALVVVSVLLFGCVKDSAGVSIACKKYAQELIPNPIAIPESVSYINITWGDNSSSNWIWFSRQYGGINCFRQGSKEGENVNYLYFNYTPFSCKEGLKYSKVVLDERGTVLGYREFEMRPTLNQVENSSTYGIADANIISCSWTLDDGTKVS